MTDKTIRISFDDTESMGKTSPAPDNSGTTTNDMLINFMEAPRKLREQVISEFAKKDGMIMIMTDGVSIKFADVSGIPGGAADTLGESSLVREMKEESVPFHFHDIGARNRQTNDPVMDQLMLSQRVNALLDGYLDENKTK